MAHLLPSAVFSPSVARQQLATAKDWKYVDSWLYLQFNGRIPPFERNNDTLKALLALVAANESADEERELLSQTAARALEDLQRRQDSNSNSDLLGYLDDSLTREGKAALDALSKLSVVVNQPVPDTEKLGSAIIDLHIASHDLDQATDRILILERYLDSELDCMIQEKAELQSEEYRSPPGLGKETLDLQKKSKSLEAKLPELKKRVASLSATTAESQVTIQDIKAEEDKYKMMMETVKQLEAQVKTYHGLPQDTDLARLEVESLKIELLSLTRQRDSMFEGLVERESPRRKGRS